MVHVRALCLAALAALCPLAARADEGVHVGVVGGLGLSQGMLGAHLQARWQHLAVFAGTGSIFVSTLGSGPIGSGHSFGGSGFGGVTGLRGYWSAAGEGTFLSGVFAFSTQQSPGDPIEGVAATWHHTTAVALTAGWRFRFGPPRAAFVLDVGAGAGRASSVDFSPDLGTFLDLNLALGFEY